MTAALSAEWLKLRRSRLPWLTLTACTIGVAVAALFMFIGAHPDKARELGLVGAKAQLAGIDPTWPGYLGLLAAVTAVAGIMIFGMGQVWAFGREFADHTAKDLLALPTTRTAIVAAKFVVTSGWSLILTVYIALAGLAAGFLLGLPGWNAGVVTHGLTTIVLTAILTIALTCTFGLAASVGRGYIASVLTMFAVVFTAQIVAALGYGRWYPYSIPAIYGGLAGPGQPPVTLTGYITLAALTTATVIGTIHWWNHSDHTR